MDINNFYSVFSATCFALVGLWWKVVEARPQWFKDEALKTQAGGIYLSFLIPGLMGLGAQVAGTASVIWRVAFAVGAVFGMYYTFRILTKTAKTGKPGPFRRNRWLVIVIYGLILLGSLGLDRLIASPAFTAIQIEALWLCLLVLIGHGLAWEFLTEAQSPTN